MGCKCNLLLGLLPKHVHCCVLPSTMLKRFKMRQDSPTDLANFSKHPITVPVVVVVVGTWAWACHLQTGATKSVARFIVCHGWSMSCRRASPPASYPRYIQKGDGLTLSEWWWHLGPNIILIVVRFLRIIFGSIGKFYLLITIKKTVKSHKI